MKSDFIEEKKKYIKKILILFRRISLNFMCSCKPVMATDVSFFYPDKWGF